MNYSKIAEILDEAARSATATEQISKSRAINLEEAYAIQAISIGRRYKRLERFTGIKLGFTSRAKMEQMGVHDLIWGRLTDRMAYYETEQLDRSDFIHPRAEPEVAFRVSRSFDKVLDMDSVHDYIDGVAIAIEIIDSRYRNFKFSLEDVVADNCSSAGYIIGEWHPVTVDYRNEDIQLRINGSPVQSGNTRAILGDPLESVLEASRLLMENGESIEEGHIILAGAATAAEYIQAGQRITASARSLGEVSLDVI